MTTTMLSHVSNQLKTVDPLFPGDYTKGFTLCDWTERGRTRISLDCGELCALLRVLPTDLLAAILGTRGVRCTREGEAPDVAEGLDALASEHDIEVEGTQFHFSQLPPVFHDGSSGGLHVAQQTTGECIESGFMCQCPACRTAQEQAAEQKEA